MGHYHKQFLLGLGSYLHLNRKVLVPSCLGIPALQSLQDHLHPNRDLDNLVSNRWRRKKGVGSQEDMQTRCNAIVAKYEGWSREDAEQLNAR